MSTKELKSPQDAEAAEQTTTVPQTSFGGMIKGDVPLSKIGLSHVYRHRNFYGYGPWSEGRPGCRRYSKAVLPEVTFTANPANDRLTTANRFNPGDRVKLRTSGALPAPLVEKTWYYVIFVDINTIELATTYANAIAGTQIDITDAGIGAHWIRYAPVLYAATDHEKESKIVKQYGSRVYVAEKPIESYVEVINLESVDPVEDYAKFAQSANAVVLAAGTIFRVVLDDDFYYMYRINTPLPTVLITDVNETGTLTFGYRFMYALGRITGTGIRNRVTDDDDVILVLETGTAKDPGQEKYFGETFFATPIGDPVIHNHIIEYLTCPIAVQSCQFFPLYRTKNIGVHSGGETNNKAFYIFVEDVPVCKPQTITVLGNVATIPAIPAGQMGWVIGDVGCTLRVDAAGTRTGEIASFISAQQVNLVAGHTLGAAEDVAIGEGRVMNASQVGYLVTRTAGDVFVLADEGRTFYWADGGETIVRRWIDANSFEAAIDDTHVAQAGTIQLNAGTYAFRRKWNDTIIDDGDSVGEIGLNERILSQRDLYIPQFNFDPIPLSNIVIRDSGFSIFANRDEVEYHYSNIGAKPYIEGQFRIDQQFGKMIVGIRDIVVMPAQAIFLCASRTFNLSLNVPIPNVGNESVGEFIQKLIEPSEVDGKIGVIHWQTVAFVNASLFIALTNEPAVRMFDGHSWSQVNFAVDSSGMPAVMDDLNKIDSFYGVSGWYSSRGGYKLFAYKWEEL